MKIEEILKERVKENKKLFNKKEIKIINSNIDIFSKIYLMGIYDISNI